MSVAGCSPLDISQPPRAAVSLQAKVQALRSAATYGDRQRTIEAIETHFAWVFLTDELVYKLKKPRRNEYIDLRELAARRASCEEEVRVNRRLAPDTYLGVTALNRARDGSLRLDGPGVAVEWLVTMRRLPGELMLDRTIAMGTTSARGLIEVGGTLADFYKRQPRIAFEPTAYVERIAGQLCAQRRELCVHELDLSAERIKTALSKLWLAFARVEDELAARAAQGRIVEAHGDLRPEHICLTSPPRIIDGLEFSLDLRTLDPGEELAFLVMECARSGDEGAGETILRTCLRELSDPISLRLLQFYRGRRAIVRAKLVASHLCDPQYRDVAHWRDQARSYLEHAIECADRACGSQGGAAFAFR